MLSAQLLCVPAVLQALNKTGCTLGTSQLRVLPSKTAIVPVNKELMPRSHEELERCSRCARAGLACYSPQEYTLRPR
jgi:NADH:ubiquinone oxidoreductase subunit F (NADH-binding)